MNDKIKEILDKCTPFLFGDEVDKLLDYITNLEQVNKNQAKRNSRQRLANTKQQELILKLQQENERLKKNQRFHKNGVFSLEYDKETLTDMVEELQEENESHINRIHELEQEIDSEYIQKENYKSRCEKADEFIQKTPFINHITKLSVHNILQNGDVKNGN